MSKKMMVLAMAVACAALLALPAAASAQTWHISSSGAASVFSVTGSGGTLTSADGLTITCTKTVGTGSFSTTTSGTVSLVFEGCSSVGFACTTPGQSSGKIALATNFNGIMVNSTASTKDPGILLTPDSASSMELTPSGASAGKKFVVEFSCVINSTKIYGNGAIGTIHSPSPPCSSVGTKTFGLIFESSVHGTAKDLTWTGTIYDMYSNSSATSHPTASLDGTATLNFASSQTITCT